MRKPADRASIQDFIKVNDHLRKAVEIVTPASGDTPAICRYVDKAITDHTIAELMDVSPSTVRNLRASGFGNLYNRGHGEGASSGEVAGLKAEVAAMHAQLARMRAEITSLKDEDALLWLRTDLIVEHFNRAVDNLALNRALPGQSGLKIKRRVMRQLPLAAE